MGSQWWFKKLGSAYSATVSPSASALSELRCIREATPAYHSSVRNAYLLSSPPSALLTAAQSSTQGAGVASRIHLNSLRADAEGDTVALYALPSFLNHHWEPNLLVDYGDDDVVFRAARPVKEGDELTIDYIHGLPQEERSAYLMENYGFDEASEIESVSL